MAQPTLRTDSNFLLANRLPDPTGIRCVSVAPHQMLLAFAGGSEPDRERTPDKTNRTGEPQCPTWLME